MHPVIDHLRARRHQKPPFADGRKIALLLGGGGMLGVRGAGALRTLEELGFAQAFDEIHALSSGFLNASYFLASQAQEALLMYPEELSGRAFLDRRRFWKIADIDYLLSIVSRKRPLAVPAILAHPTRLFTTLIGEAKGGGPQYIEVHNYPPEEYLRIIRAAAFLPSAPFAGRGTVEIGGRRYRSASSGRPLANLMAHILAGDATDVLALYNHPRQRERVDRATGLSRKDLRVFEFCPCSEPMSRLETRPELLRRSGEAARVRTRMILGF